jgi:hypothetical protein
MSDDVLGTLRQELAPGPGHNRLAESIGTRPLPLRAIGALAAEEYRIVASDRRSFHTLAARAPVPASDFFAYLAQGEALVHPAIPVLAAACGLDDAALRAYEPLPGCQAYPGYVALLALGGEPADVAAALTVNFAAWGGYCAAIAGALRAEHGFGDEECRFFDFFATPAPEMGALSEAAVRAGPGATLAAARTHARLLQSYESMFWNTLADLS